MSDVVNQLEVCYMDTSNDANAWHVIPLWQGICIVCICIVGLNSGWCNYQWVALRPVALLICSAPRLTALCRLQRIQSHMVSKSSHVLVLSKKLTNINSFVHIIYCVSFYVFFLIPLRFSLSVWSCHILSRILTFFCRLTQLSCCLYLKSDVKSGRTRCSFGESGMCRCDHHKQTKSSKCPEPEHDPTDVPSAQGTRTSTLN